MKRILTAIAIVSAVTFGGCAQVKEFVDATTTTITNPVSAVDIYRVKNVYAATLQAAVDWRTYCYSKSYKAILADPVMKPVCQNRRAVVLAVQSAQPKAASALKSAEDFVAQNPTINATAAISAAWAAVANFKNAIPVVAK